MREEYVHRPEVILPLTLDPYALYIRANSSIASIQTSFDDLFQQSAMVEFFRKSFGDLFRGIWEEGDLRVF